jgi:hypothetical protein
VQAKERDREKEHAAAQAKQEPHLLSGEQSKNNVDLGRVSLWEKVRGSCTQQHMNSLQVHISLACYLNCAAIDLHGELWLSIVGR